MPAPSADETTGASAARPEPPRTVPAQPVPEHKNGEPAAGTGVPAPANRIAAGQAPANALDNGQASPGQTVPDQAQPVDGQVSRPTPRRRKRRSTQATRR